MKLQTCRVCSRPSRSPRCDRHQLPPRPRGNAFEPTRQRVAERDGWTCALCGEAIDPALRKPHPDALHIDHLEQRAAGGSDDPSNLRATHARCNKSRPTGR